MYTDLNITEITSRSYARPSLQRRGDLSGGGGPHSTSAAGENGAVSEEFIISEEFIARTCLPATRREGRAVLGLVEGDLGLVEDAGCRQHEDPQPLMGTPRARSQRPQIPVGFCSGAMPGHAGGGERAGHPGGRSRGAGISAGVCLQTEHPGHRPAPGPAPAPSGSRINPLLLGRGDLGRKHPALSPPRDEPKPAKLGGDGEGRGPRHGTAGGPGGALGRVSYFSAISGAG